MENPIKLGMWAQDTITGYAGVVTARAEYLHGAPRVLLEHRDNTGRPIEWWFDETRVLIVDEPV